MSKGYGVIALTITLALLMGIYPLSGAWAWFRPEWLTMVVIYWVIALPGRVGVGVAWLCGLVLDGFQGVTLGQNAFGLAMVAYICLVLYQRMRNFTPLQQAGMVFVLVGIQLLFGYWVSSLAARPSIQLSFLGAALTSAILWPWFAELMRSLRRRYVVV